MILEDQNTCSACAVALCEGGALRSLRSLVDGYIYICMDVTTDIDVGIDVDMDVAT